MHCALRRSHSNSQRPAHKGKSPLLRSSSNINNFRTSSEVCKQSLATRNLLDHRCEILTFLTLEPDGWKIIALPVNMETLPLVSIPASNLFKLDWQSMKSSRSYDTIFPIKPSTSRTCSPSIVQPLQNETSTDSVSKSNDSSNDATNSSDMPINDPKLNETAKKMAKRKSRKRSKAKKKPSHEVVVAKLDYEDELVLEANTNVGISEDHKNDSIVLESISPDLNSDSSTIAGGDNQINSFEPNNVVDSCNDVMRIHNNKKNSKKGAKVCINDDLIDNDSEKLAQAINDAYKVQLVCESFQMTTGVPIAEIERFLHMTSPVIMESCSVQCKVPKVSLGNVWNWYERHGNYGLEVKVEDCKYTKSSNGNSFQALAYFVPLLSAVQIFGKREMSKHAKNPCAYEKSLRSDGERWSDDSELLFEYFEIEQPQKRRHLFEKIEELVKGGNEQFKGYGDPTKLGSIDLHDLHPKSWYSVAWYPIYKIPDGVFRATFLNYHSLGHLVNTSVMARYESSRNMNIHVVCPVVGLQSYNAQGECWFNLKYVETNHMTDGSNLYPCRIFEDRLRTLEHTASLMSRASVSKGNITCTNRHWDYEFFVSRM